MSDLEKYIRDHRDDFDEVDLPLGHEGRFEMRLERRNNESKDRIRFWRVAAAIIVLVVAGGTLLLPRLNSPADVQYGSMALGEVSGEMADIERYYASKLSEEYQKLGDLSQSNEQVKRLFDELEVLNLEYSELEKQLYRSGTNDRVILAMIENFRLRLSIVEKLEKIKQEQTS